MAASTLSRVSGRVPRVPFKTCETVAMETPARAATSLMLEANPTYDTPAMASSSILGFVAILLYL